MPSDRRDENRAENAITYGWLAHTLRSLRDCQSLRVLRGDSVYEFPRLHLLAHGLGSRVALLALREAHKDMVPPVIGELILASADVGVDTDFAPVKALLPRMCHAVTQYYSPTDKALKFSASRIMHNEPRVGQVNGASSMAMVVSRTGCMVNARCVVDALQY